MKSIKALDLTDTSVFFSDLFPIGSLIQVEQYIMAFLVIMVLLRLFKYLKMMPLSGPTTQAILEVCLPSSDNLLIDHAKQSLHSLRSSFRICDHLLCNYFPSRFWRGHCGRTQHARFSVTLYTTCNTNLS